jgi:hypothetical protein
MLRCTPASSLGLLASRFSGPMQRSVPTSQECRPVDLICFRPPIPEARYFFNTKTFALLLEILASCSTQTCFNCCFPALPCSLQRSRPQWQRHCSTAAFVPINQHSATHLISSPTSVPKGICQTFTSFRFEVIKSLVLVINLQHITNGISSMTSVVCCQSGCFRRNPRRPRNEEEPLLRHRKLRKSAKRPCHMLHLAIGLSQLTLGSNRLLLRGLREDRNPLLAASCSLTMKITISIRVQSSSERKFLIKKACPVLMHNPLASGEYAETFLAPSSALHPTPDSRYLVIIATQKLIPRYWIPQTTTN